jgi:hypothetical protein
MERLFLCAKLKNKEFTYYFSEVTINRLREKVREYEDKIEETAKVCDYEFDSRICVNKCLIQFYFSVESKRERKRTTENFCRKRKVQIVILNL